MDPGIKAKRLAIARQEVEESALLLAESMDLHDEVERFLAAKQAPAAARDVYQIEATASLLKAMVGGALSDRERIEAAVGEANADALADAGFDSVGAIVEASDEDLDAVDGIGPATITKLRDAFGEGA